MITSPPRRLVIGYGNPARRDDGLGPALAERISALNFPGVTVEIDYQLVVETAYKVGEYEEVLFVDAARNGTAPFFMRPVEPKPEAGLISHGLSPEGVIYLAGILFGTVTKGYLLGIRGYNFEPFNESLTDVARHNLELAVSHAEQWLRRSGE